jgi:transcriptional antiterminator NusG
MEWYIINVFNGKETSIAADIEKNLELEGHMINVNRVVVPKEKYFQVRKQKKIKSEKTYFPGYVFIECNINGEIVKSIQNNNGVIGVLKSDRGPIPMNKREVKNLLSKIETIEITDNVSLDKIFLIGQEVKILDGPFASFIGDITEIHNKKQEIVVNVNIFSRKTPVTLKPDQIINI